MSLCMTAVMLVPQSMAQKQPVTVAVVLATTGIAAAHNKPLLPLIRLAVEEINRNGGLAGHRMNLLMLDNRSTPIGSGQAAVSAINNQAVAVIGAHWSSHSLAMAPWLQQAKIPMITISTNPAITRVGNYIFRINTNDRIQGEMLARFARRELRARSAVVLKNVNEVYSMTLGNCFGETFRQAGGTLLFEAGYKGDAVNFQEILTRVASTGPDVVFIPGYSRDSGLIINQATSRGIQTVFLGADAWDGIGRYAAETLDGSYCTAVWHPRMATPAGRQLLETYKERYRRELTNFSAVPWYDAFMLLRDAVDRAKYTAPEKIRDALARTRNFHGVGGTITLDENGDPQNREMVVLKYDKKTPLFFERLAP